MLDDTTTIIAATFVLSVTATLWFTSWRYERIKSRLPTSVTNIMLDLETLGKEPGCKVLSIGAAVFDAGGTRSTFYVEVARNKGQDMLIEDPDTIEWWARQSAEARTLLNTPDDEKVTLTAALIEFNNWLRSVAVTDSRGNLQVAIWGNGADFDNAILGYAYKAVDVKQAWPYWANRCYRTLKSLAPRVRMVRTGTPHHALDDAVSQADHAADIIAELGLWG
jgi:exodeoxyribonuclease VIII